jgi:hypothetical protein
MLRSFRLANHGSIRTEQELLLFPVYDTDRPVQPVSAIYGANASGTSTVLDGLRFLEELTRPNALFLSVASRADFIEPLPVYEWFRSGLKFMDPIRGAAALAEAVAELLESSPQLYRQLVNLLRFADVGISELLIGTTLGLGAALSWSTRSTPVCIPY